ncbi:MAG: class I SAM-dependent methyltransferase [Candidatus Rokuibacteriota bacterium]
MRSLIRRRITRTLVAVAPAPVKRWLKAQVAESRRGADEDTLVRQYLEGGCIPWSTGYGEYRMLYVARALEDRRLLHLFRHGGALPEGHGLRLDERAVEYPWTLSRADSWGPVVLDAGSTLNHPTLLATPFLANRHVIVYNLEHDWVGKRARLSYLTGDLRDMILKDAVVDTIVCISTLEHIGLDNTFLYTTDSSLREKRPTDYRRALAEFWRVLRPGGRLLVTVPYGRPGVLRWLQQFDRAGVEDIAATFGGRALDVSYFKYEPAGWTRASAEACAACEYFDVHARLDFDADFAAAARAVACLELEKPAET